MNPKYFIIRCLRCNQKNRVKRDQQTGRPMCGRCGAYLDELILSCLICHKKNRIREDKLHDCPVCGHCGAPLYQGYVQSLSDKTFDNEIDSFPAPVFLCCWAPWCVSCRIVLPFLEQIAPRYDGGIKIAKLNIDENPLIASRYSVSKTPTFLIFRNRKLHKTLTGILTKEEIEAHLKSLVKKQDSSPM